MWPPGRLHLSAPWVSLGFLLWSRESINHCTDPPQDSSVLLTTPGTCVTLLMPRPDPQIFWQIFKAQESVFLTCVLSDPQVSSSLKTLGSGFAISSKGIPVRWELLFKSLDVQNYSKLTWHWKRPWCWEGLGAGGEGDDRRWDGWMASPTWWTWVWVNSGSWWWTGRPDVLRLMGSQRIRHDWATELNWTELNIAFGQGNHCRWN